MNELQQVINFTDADLKANTAGHLSLAQRQKLQERQKRSLSLLTMIAGVIALMVLGAVLLGNLGVLVLGIMALIIGVMALVEYVVGYQTYTRDLQANHVETIQGVVRYIWRGDSIMGVETHPAGIKIGDMKFLLMEDQARAFIEGEIYVLHYAPTTHTLLSAEWVQLVANHQDDEVAYWEHDETTYQQSGQI